MNEVTTKCLIIGSGPAGYTAGIYASRAGMKPLMVEGGQPGGQLTITTEVENFPGYVDGVAGPQLMQDLRAQAVKYGLEILSGSVTEVDFSQRPFTAIVNNGQTSIKADTVIISTGASARFLGLEDEEKYRGLGVSACATCDGFFYRGRSVAVVGGGDTACEEALYLANLASKVYMIVRKDYLRASKVMQQRVFDNPKIEVLFNTVTKGLFGEEYLEGAHVETTNADGTVANTDIAIDGFFLAIGHKPNTDLFVGQIDLDGAGYIKTAAPSTATNIPGVFAAGDVADPNYQQAIAAAGTGCRAALDAEKFILLNS